MSGADDTDNKGNRGMKKVMKMRFNGRAFEQMVEILCSFDKIGNNPLSIERDKIFTGILVIFED